MNHEIKLPFETQNSNTVDEPLLRENVQYVHSDEIEQNTHPAAKLSQHRWLIKLFKMYDLYHDPRDTVTSKYCARAVSYISLSFGVILVLSYTFQIIGSPHEGYIYYSVIRGLNIITCLLYFTIKATVLYNVQCNKLKQSYAFSKSLQMDIDINININCSDDNYTGNGNNNNNKTCTCCSINSLVSFAYILTITIHIVLFFGIIWMVISQSSSDVFGTIKNYFIWVSAMYYVGISVATGMAYICLVMFVRYIIALEKLFSRFENITSNYNYNYNTDDINIKIGQSINININDGNGDDAAKFQASSYIVLAKIIENYTQLYKYWIKSWHNKEMLYVWEMAVFLLVTVTLVYLWEVIRFAFTRMYTYDNNTTYFVFGYAVMSVLPLIVFFMFAIKLSNVFTIFFNGVKKEIENQCLGFETSDANYMYQLQTLYFVMDKHRVIITVIGFEITSGNMIKLMVAFLLGRFGTLAVNTLY